MKPCHYNNFKVGKIYDTLRKRSFERHLYSQTKRAREYKCGDCYPEDNFMVLELKEINNLKWTKILTSQGMVGWILWLEVLDHDPAFVELP